MNKEDIIPTGKYRGHTVQEVLDTNPQYILSTAERHHRIVFSDDILEEAQDKVELQEYTQTEMDYQYKNSFTKED